MEHVISGQAENKEQTDIISDEVFIKNIANGGSGLVAIVRSPDLKILFQNEQFEYYLGYNNDDIAGTGVYFRSLIENYQFDLLGGQLNRVIENISARSHFMIYRLKSKNGTVNPYYLYASPIFNENNEPGQYFHLLMHPDLSKWGMPFTSFETKEVFLEQFKGEKFGTFEWILDSDKVFWSQRMYDIYEADKNQFDLNSKYVERFIHPNDADRVAAVIKTSLENEIDINIEYKIITARNNVKIIHCLARIIKNLAGENIKLAGCIRDVTEQRHIEDSLKNKVEELNHSNRELEEFAYVASHDIQEPLRKITTFSDRLSEKYKDVLAGDGALYLSRIIASAENMRILINELLEFSRITKTEQPYEPTNLNLILRSVISDLEITIEDTGTIIRSQELPVIDAVATQMKQLLTNIITNAIKFHKPGIAPVITIESKILTPKEKLHFELMQDHVYYKLQVTDNGIGFEEEYATRIFQVFQRLHGKSEYPGSGIGLAICKKILEYHHGAIFAENISQKGARFVFILPRRQPHLNG